MYLAQDLILELAGIERLGLDLVRHAVCFYWGVNLSVIAFVVMAAVTIIFVVAIVFSEFDL